MAKHLMLLFMFVLQSARYVQAQSTGQVIKGKVEDSASKRGLENANITINSKQGSISKSVASGKSGQFSVVLPRGHYSFTITYAGYKTLETVFEVTDTDKTLPLFFLVPANGNLKMVSVEANKPLITVSAGKIIMNVAESAVASGSTAWNVLQIAPGVMAGDDGSLTLNGKTTSVYIDGRVSYLGGEQLKNLFTAMQANNIDKIELIGNPSAKYDAAGQAIIHIRTKKITKKGFNGVYTSGIGASRFLKYNSGIELNWFKNKANFYASYDFSHSANNYLPLNLRTSFSGGKLFYITEAEGELRKRNNHNIKAGVDYSPSGKTTLGFLVKFFRNERDRKVNGFTWLGQQKNHPDSLISTVTTGTAVFSSPAVNLYYRTNFDSEKKELLFNADYYRYGQQWSDEFNISFKDNSGNKYRPDEARRDNSPAILDIYALAVDYSRRGKKVKFETGLKASFIQTDNDLHWENNFGNGWVNDVLRTNHFIYKENINAAYAGITAASKKSGIELMVRAEQTNTTGYSVTLNSHFTRHYANLFPFFSWLKKINTKNELTLSYRKSIRRPFYSYTNPFLIYQGQYNYFQGNPGMKPSYSHSFQLAYSYNKALVTTVSYTYERNALGVFYRQNDSTKTITRFFDNYKNAQTTLLTVAYSKYLKPWWTTTTTGLLSYERAAYTGLISGNSTLRLFLNSSNTFIFKKAGMRLELSGNYMPGYTDGFYRYQPFGSLNIGFQKEILKKKGTLRLGIRDIFKTQIVKYTALYSNVDISTAPYYDSRNFQLGFSYRFGKQFVNNNKNRKNSIESEVNRIN